MFSRRLVFFGNHRTSYRESFSQSRQCGNDKHHQAQQNATLMVGEGPLATPRKSRPGKKGVCIMIDLQRSCHEGYFTNL
jgi:hypothetical protein